MKVSANLTFNNAKGVVQNIRFEVYTYNYEQLQVTASNYTIVFQSSSFAIVGQGITPRKHRNKCTIRKPLLSAGRAVRRYSR